MLRELGRLEVGLVELKAALDSAPSLRFLPLDLAQLDEFALLPSLRDPFDRLIVSAARSRFSGTKMSPLALVTAEKVPSSGV